MSRLPDLETNCAVRRVLVRHWIDLGKISLRTTNGVVSLSGELLRLSHGGNALTPASLLQITSELSGVPRVRRISVNFTNWANVNGIWKAVVKTGSTPEAMPQSLKPQPSTFEIDDVPDPTQP